MGTSDAPISAEDEAHILTSARDYIEAWLDGDAERMGRCLHPELAKRSVEIDPATGARVVESLTRDQMMGLTAAGHGRKYARPYELAILDAYGDIATVRLLSSVYMDYLHLARWGERWLILNCLWQRRPGQ